MNTKYKGLYIIRKVGNEIIGIQVGFGAFDLPLTVEDYEKRCVQPPISELPEKDEYFKNK